MNYSLHWYLVEVEKIVEIICGKLAKEEVIVKCALNTLTLLLPLHYHGDGGQLLFPLSAKRRGGQGVRLDNDNKKIGRAHV